ncbi:MAG: cation-efflux pump [Chloroflexi bacterium]|nr:MAG: cation-efflux pump [Chloroflexota bacterium]
MQTQSTSLTRYAWLSVAAALATLALKFGAYWFTGSVGLLSDALESLVNLAGALMALAMLTVAARPPDDEHNFGHNKAEYFSSGVEGSLILVAAAGIAATAIPRLLFPRPLEDLGLGLAIGTAAALVNLAVGLILLRAARQHGSITLEADAQHLLTDVWTSVGVLAAVGLVALTGWQRLDPIIALLVAANITWTGTRILRASVAGLMDTALPPDELAQITAILNRYRAEGIEFHAVTTRQAGTRRFVSMHVLVPGGWSVQQGHQLLEAVEAELHAALPQLMVSTHLEPLGELASYHGVEFTKPV